MSRLISHSLILRTGCAALSMALAAAAVPRASWADDGLDNGETLLGVIDTPPASMIPGTPLPGQSVSPFADAIARSPAETFQSAMTALQQGLFDSAQRLFEVFVATAPDHPSAPEARRHLGELYQRDDAAPPPGKVPLPVAAGPVTAPLSARVLARRVTQARPVAGAVEDRFMLEAGDRVFFSAGSADLGGRARVVLSAQARWLKRNANLSAVIEGHADDAPMTADELERLSAERAQAVYDRLLEEGVPAVRLAIAPMGPSRPVAQCQTVLCAAQNRRAVTVLTPQRLSELPPMERAESRETR